MFVIAQHKISDASGFMNAVQQAAPNIPADMKLHQFLPDADGSSAVCLWEAASVDRVRQLVDMVVGKFGSNVYYEVAPAKAVGLPASSR
jgi:hypothetical protein